MFSFQDVNPRNRGAIFFQRRCERTLCRAKGATAHTANKNHPPAVLRLFVKGRNFMFYFLSIKIIAANIASPLAVKGQASCLLFTSRRQQTRAVRPVIVQEVTPEWSVSVALIRNARL